MPSFELAPQLQQDCHVLAESDISLLLLLDNALYPWFLIVPKTQHTEIYQLDIAVQQQLLAQMNGLSQFIDKQFKPDKLNVAAIGNVVSQLHIHHIARFKTDDCWPGVVWGQCQQQSYQKAQVDTIRLACEGALSSWWQF
ncbi:HIT domain-containing protein [Motilimonas pumila]|uniref:HIT family protein n=1 Tax=Motilimonas pumila TaxID=2303987 RepID=A0A418YIS6_9GAMM|nr:HIT family protein [Motilimonas pumila]RJG50551.1 HIT family protein [Motilimonas pumila]